MKKLLAVVICCLILVSFVGCNPNKSDNAKSSASPTSSEIPNPDKSQIGIHYDLSMVSSDPGDGNISADDAGVLIAEYIQPQADYNLNKEKVVFRFIRVESITGTDYYIFDFGPMVNGTLSVTHTYAVDVFGSEIMEKEGGNWTSIKTLSANPHGGSKKDVTNANYGIAYNREGMSNWKENTNEYSDASVLLKLENSTKTGTIKVSGSLLGSASVGLEEYAESCLSDLKREYTNSDISEVYEVDDGVNVYKFIRITSADGKDITEYITLRDLIALRIRCVATGSLSGGVMNEFEGVFLDNEFDLIEK